MTVSIRTAKMCCSMKMEKEVQILPERYAYSEISGTSILI